MIKLSAFRTRENRQPTSKFVAACLCPDGLMQDGTQEGNVAYVILHRGACSRGYKRREGARARASGREGESPCVPPVSSAPPVLDVQRCQCCSVCPRRPTLSVLQRLSSTCLRKAMDIPFYRYKEMPNCTRGCSYVLSWMAKKHLEPCTRANVAVGEVP
jgi:hypothetical protein